MAKAIIIVLLFCTASITNAAAQGRTISYGDSGYWHIYAYYENNGAFGYCGMRTGSRNGPESLTLTANGRGIIVFFDSSTWSLPAGAQYGVQVFIGDAKWYGNAVVYAPIGVMMTFDWESGFADAFSRGSVMLMRFSNGRIWTLNLSGSDAALRVLAGCLRGNEVAGNPFASAPPYATNPFR